MKLNFNKVQGFAVPEKLFQLINTELAEITTPENTANSITLNFRDQGYSAESGGYHPVEIRLEKKSELWQIAYITDFSFQGSPFPELIKEIDICFITKQVFSLFCGWLQNKSAKELLNLFIDNFVEYYSMDCYQVSISVD